MTFHPTVDQKPLIYNKPPLTTGYTHKGKLNSIEETGNVVDVKTQKPTIK